ncbi:MAG: type I restriction enzyme HsdR N-terminal domain-containing protein [Rikenellaceae bacterium]|jgi:hypothetical protein|nr:type I restriction enzyme HsdR N-terminal domain-containing protein [Rikenellaceae bacterium]
MSQPKLNFPPCDIPERDGRLWDDLRRMWLPATPEERVRRRLAAWLVSELGMDRGLIVQEYAFMLGAKPFRADVVCFSTSREPLLLVECKAPDVTLDGDVLAQAVKYNSVVRARYLMLTNGLKHYFFERTPDGGHRQIDALPQVRP